MEIKQYKVVSGIATPVNPYTKQSPQFEANADHDYFKSVNSKWEEFEAFAESHTYACDAQDGVYDADCFGEVVWQIKGKLNVDWVTIDEKHESYKLLPITSDRCKRQFLQLKHQPMPELPIPKMETTELPSHEKGVKTADQFSQLPWYEQIKYIPVAGALCSNGFQELTDKQLETYKNSKVTAAIRYKLQPANNDYAVKESQWVSVEDSVPTTHKQIVFVLRDGYELPTTAEYYINCKGFWAIDNRVYKKDGIIRGSQYKDVTHWMPVPSPPTIKPIKL